MEFSSVQFSSVQFSSVPMVARSEARAIFDCSNIWIADSNPARGVDVYPRFSVLCCPVLCR
jgi:hypothetical protein